jgi:hypothetical protein
MEQEKLFDQLKNLPPEAQREVADFIAFLQSRYTQVRVKKQSKRVSLSNESFIGMWRDREDMQDSRAWVQSARKSEWGNSRA